MLENRPVQIGRKADISFQNSKLYNDFLYQKNKPNKQKIFLKMTKKICIIGFKGIEIKKKTGIKRKSILT